MGHKVICISRDCGSGGHIVGEIAAKKLVINYYDKNLIQLAMECGGISSSVLHDADEKATNPAFYRLIYEGNDKVEKGRPANEVLFQLQRDLIREITKKEDCVIVGRCADYILRNANVSMVNVYITAPKSMRIKREMTTDQLTKFQAASLIRKIDDKRRKYYQYFTKREWGNPDMYDITLNSSHLGLERCADILVHYYETYL